MSDSLTRGLEAMRAQMDPRAMSYLSSCVRCGICAEACLFYTETGDARYTPIHKVEPLRKLLEARTQLSNLMTYMDGKTGAEELIQKTLQDPALLQALASAPKPKDDEGKPEGE